jgi:hypothetical protein
MRFTFEPYLSDQKEQRARIDDVMIVIAITERSFPPSGSAIEKIKKVGSRST